MPDQRTENENIFINKVNDLILDLKHRCCVLYNIPFSVRESSFGPVIKMENLSLTVYTKDLVDAKPGTLLLSFGLPQLMTEPQSIFHYPEYDSEGYIRPIEPYLSQKVDEILSKFDDYFQAIRDEKDRELAITAINNRILEGVR